MFNQKYWFPLTQVGTSLNPSHPYHTLDAPGIVSLALWIKKLACFAYVQTTHTGFQLHRLVP
jgi:hypothetical protein